MVQDWIGKCHVQYKYGSIKYPAPKLLAKQLFTDINSKISNHYR